MVRAVQVDLFFDLREWCDLPSLSRHECTGIKCYLRRKDCYFLCRGIAMPNLKLMPYCLNCWYSFWLESQPLTQLKNLFHLSWFGRELTSYAKERKIVQKVPAADLAGTSEAAAMKFQCKANKCSKGWTCTAEQKMYRRYARKNCSRSSRTFKSCDNYYYYNCPNNNEGCSINRSWRPCRTWCKYLSFPINLNLICPILADI